MAEISNYSAYTERAVEIDKAILNIRASLYTLKNEHDEICGQIEVVDRQEAIVFANQLVEVFKQISELEKELNSLEKLKNNMLASHNRVQGKLRNMPTTNTIQ